MAYRTSRLYSWREVQELARALQSMRRASRVDVKTDEQRQRERADQLMSAPMTPEDALQDASQSRIVRVERLKAEHALKKPERPDHNTEPTRSSSVSSFNLQAFKAAWRAGQQEVTPYSPLNEVSVTPLKSQSSNLTPTQTAQPQGVDRASNARVATSPPSPQGSTRTQASGASSSPWELLRDHFVAQHRLYQAQRERREEDQDT